MFGQPWLCNPENQNTSYQYWHPQRPIHPNCSTNPECSCLPRVKSRVEPQVSMHPMQSHAGGVAEQQGAGSQDNWQETGRPAAPDEQRRGPCCALQVSLTHSYAKCVRVTSLGKAVAGKTRQKQDQQSVIKILEPASSTTIAVYSDLSPFCCRWQRACKSSDLLHYGPWALWYYLLTKSAVWALGAVCVRWHTSLECI